MTAAGYHAVHPAPETSNSSAAGYLSNDLEQFWIVRQEVQQTQSDFVCHGNFHPDAFVGSWKKVSLFDSTQDEL